MSDFGFVGGAYETESRYQDAQELINWYCEIDKEKPQGDRGVIALYPTPGLALASTPGGSYPVRALHTLSGNNNLLAVVGNGLYSLTNVAIAVNATFAGSINGFNRSYDLLGNTLESVNSLVGSPSIYKNDWQGKQLQYTSARTNMLLFSQAFDNAAWTKLGCTVAGGIIAPDGSTAAYKLSEDGTAAAYHQIYETGRTTSAAVYTGSVYLKQAERLYAYVSLFDGVNLGAFFNLATGALVSTEAGVTASIQAAPNGYYHCTVSRTMSAGVNSGLVVSPSPNGTQYIYNGVIGNGIYAFGAQMESGAVATSYIPTTAAPVTVTDYALTNPAHVVFAVAPLSGSVLTWNGNYISSIQANNLTGLYPTFAGNLNTSSGNVSISDNGIQAMIVDGANRYSYATNGNQNAIFTGSITNGILTVTSVTSGTVVVGQILTGAGISTGTAITYPLTATTFGVSVTTNATSTTITATGGLTVLPLSDGPFVGGDIVDTIDNYFIFNYPSTQQWAASNALSTTTPALSFASKFSAEDKLVAIAVNNRIVYLLGEVTTEAWSDVGSFPFPFALIPGSTAQHGCAAKGSVAQIGDSFAYVSRDRKGQGIIVIMNGYSPVRISTHAVETSLSGKVISDAVAYSYQLNGHEFYAVTFPSIDITWVYNLMTDKWHKWLSVDANGIYHRSRINCMAVFNGQIYAGDYQNGNIYTVSNSVFTDNGVPIRRMRRCPHLVSDFARVFHQELQIQFQPGIGLQTGQGSNPQAMLRWSDDGGSTWSNEHWLPIGLVGKYKHRIIKRRLGYARDRVYETSVSDPIFATVISANLKVDVGE